METKITENIVNTITDTRATRHGIIDVPQGDEGAFRKLCYFNDPEEIIPMEISGDKSAITFEILVPEHVRQYGSRIAPFLYGTVRSLVKNIAPYPYGPESFAEFNDKGTVTFAIYNRK